MTKRQAARQARLLPAGVPRWVRVYDNGGESWDRYTAIYTGRYRHLTGGSFWVRGMSEHPFHPQGFGQMGEYDRQIDTNDSGFAPAIGRKNHLGKRIRFEDLPEDAQRCVLMDYTELWDLTVDTGQKRLF